MKPRRVSALTSAVAAAAIAVAGAGQAGAAPISAGVGVPDSEPVSVTLTLTGTAPNAVERYAAQVTRLGSVAYRRHLTRAQLRQLAGAPDQRVRRVEAWARAAGLTVDGLDTTGTRLTLHGSARTARAAFGVSLVQETVHGVRVRVASGQSVVPQAVAADIRAVSGLSQYPAYPMLARQGAPLARALKSGSAAPQAAQNGLFCSTFWAEWNNAAVPQRYPAGAQSNPVCGYNGAQLRALYGLAGTDRGAGQTIVIVGAFNSPTALADANTTFATNGVAALPASRYQVKVYTPSTGSNGCNVSSWNAEQALDIQTVHTIAPDATIVYAASPDCTTLVDTEAKVINDASIPTTIISNSWSNVGEPSDTQYLTAVNQLLAGATVLGIGAYFATADFGDWTGVLGNPAVAFPASSPWATAVGGTSAGIGAGNLPVFQTGWEDGGNSLADGAWTPTSPRLVFGGGGGASSHFDRPSWQTTASGGKRGLPDISALADPYTGLLVGFTTAGTYAAVPLGGTSLATPILAALVAVAQARAGTDADVGLLTPTLYSQAAAGKAVAADVRHVGAGVWTPQLTPSTPGGNYLVDVDADPQTLHTATGYDTVTGLGTPGSAFLTAITS